MTTIFYLVFAVVTAFGFGGSVDDEILTVIHDKFHNFRDGWYVASIACVSLMLTQIPVILMCVFSSVEQNYPSMKESRCKRSGYRAGLVAFSLGLACLPGGLFKDFLGIVPGGVISIFPIWFYWAGRSLVEQRRDSTSRSLLYEYCVDGADGRAKQDRRDDGRGISKWKSFTNVISTDFLKFSLHLFVVFIAVSTSIFGMVNSVQEMLHDM